MTSIPQPPGSELIRPPRYAGRHRRLGITTVWAVTLRRVLVALISPVGATGRSPS